MRPWTIKERGTDIVTAGSTPSQATRIAASVSLMLAVLLVAGCSSATKLPIPVTATSTASDATPSEPSSATQAPSASAPAPGTVVLDQNQLATVCRPPQPDSTDSTDSTGSTGSAGSITAVLPGAVAIISCGTETAGYDLNAAQILWQQPIGTAPSSSGDSAPKISVDRKSVV